jgi:hypothetical protein
MSIVYRKYEFDNWEQVKSQLQTIDSEGNVSWVPAVNAIVELGHLCTQWGVDEEGNQVCEATNPLYAVDILWNAKDSSLDSSIVWPAPAGIHIFAGWEAQYAADYCAANPEAEYCQPPTPPVDEVL